MGLVILIAVIVVGVIGFSSWRRGTARSWVADIDYATSMTDATTRLSSNTRRGDAFLGTQTCTVANENAKELVERARALGLSVRHFFGDQPRLK